MPKLTQDEEMVLHLYREHPAFFIALVKSNIHSLKNATALLSFDPMGELRQVKVEQVVYRHS